jgi:hypothetical protein
MKMIRLLAILSVCMLSSTSWAVVSPLFVTLFTNSYTVPSGKVLVLQSIEENVGGSVVVTPPGSSLSIGISGNNTTAAPNVMSYTVALKFPAGTTFSGSGSLSALYGLLVDPTDLYVAMPSSFGQFASVGNTIQGNLNLGSPAPASVRVQSSTNLTTWNYDATVAVRPTPQKEVVAITAPQDPSAHQKYYRALVLNTNL